MTVAVLGRHGFIGSALTRKLEALGHTVQPFPTKETAILYHVASPVHPPFEMNPDYHLTEILSSFSYLLPFCRENKIRFIYPSSALIYEQDTLFKKCKQLMEIYASCYPDTLGLRIFPTYGVGETRTAIYQWCRDMLADKEPIVYGDGTQTRDFIYIDDVVDAIIKASLSQETGVKDIGSGNPVTFNEIIGIINDVLGKSIKPRYVAAPKAYSKGVTCHHPVKTTIPLREGITRVCDTMRV